MAPPHMQAIAKAFVDYRIDLFRVRYEPMCGTTTNGMITLAFAPTNKATTGWTAEDIAALQPNVSGPLFQPHTITCPIQYLREKNWYPVLKGNEETSDANTPACLCVAIEGDSAENKRTFGKLWLDYEVVYLGFDKV